MAVLEDRADLHGELALAVLALPQTACRKVRVLGALALRAHRAIRPPQLGDVLDAHVGINEVADRLDQRLRRALRAHKVSLRLTAR